MKEAVINHGLLPDILYGVVAPMTVASLTLSSEQGIRVRLYEPVVSFMLRALIKDEMEITFSYRGIRFTLDKHHRNLMFDLANIRLRVGIEASSSSKMVEYVWHDRVKEPYGAARIDMLLDRVIDEVNRNPHPHSS